MKENLDYILFVYGLSFFVLSTIAFRLWREKLKTSLQWQWLALFGLLHGMSKWLGMLAMSASFYFSLRIFTLIMMAVSFCCLFEFGRRSCRDDKGHSLVGIWMYAPLILLCSVCGLHGLTGWNIGFRYSFGLFGGLLAGLAFFLRAKDTPFDHKEWLRMGAVGFFLYAIASGFVVPRLDFFPASIVNDDAFLRLTGVVVQVIRALCAGLIAFFCFLIFINLRISWSSESVRRHIKRVFLWQALILITFVILGWFFVHKVSEEKIASKKEYLLKQARILSKSINPEHIMALKGTKDDVLLPQYIRIWGQLQKIVEIFPEYRFAYLMSSQDRRLVFLVDSEPLGSADRSMPGDVYDDASADFQNAFVRKEESFSGPDTDQWGTWVTLTVPIFDPRTGSLLAMFCLDQDAQDWTTSFFQDRLKGISLVLILSIFVLLGFFIFGRDRPLGKRFFYAETFYVAGFCLLMAACVFLSVFSKSREDLFDKFQQVAINAEQIFYSEMNSVRTDLDYLSRFFRASQNVDRAEFHFYALGLVRDYLGRQAFAWLPRVKQEEVALYEEKAREDGLSDFFIFEKSTTGEKRQVAGRPEYFPLYYLEPRSDNKSALGFDAYSEPLRRDALMRAQESGLRCATGWIDFVVHQKERKSGFLVYQPIDENQMMSADVEGSPRALKGFLMAAIRPQAILETGLLGGPRGRKQLAQIIVLDLNDPSGIKMIASYPHMDDRGKEKLKDFLKRKPGELKEVTLNTFFGNSYAIVAIPTKAFFDEYPQNLPWVICLGGLFLTTVLSALSFVLQNARRHAEKIVEQRTAELFESEQRFRSLFDNMADGVAIYKGIDDGQDFIFVDINKAGERLSQVSRKDVVGKRVTHVFPGVQDLGLLKAFTRVWKTGTSEICPQSLYKDGRIEQWVENFVCKVSKDLVAAIYTDMTNLKRSQEALSRAHKDLASIMDAATRVSIISTDLSGIIKTFNKGAENLLGYRSEEVVGKKVYSLIHLESEMVAYDKVLSQEFGYHVSGFETFVARVKRGLHEEHEWTYLKKDGASLTVNLVVTAIKDEKGAMTGFLGIATDVTERKQSDERLKRSLADLQQFHAATINRESRVIELKKEINALSLKLGQQPPYDLSFLSES